MEFHLFSERDDLTDTVLGDLIEAVGWKSFMEELPPIGMTVLTDNMHLLEVVTKRDGIHFRCVHCHKDIPFFNLQFQRWTEAVPLVQTQGD